jgi:predicted Zn-ribbon and HTH transcriptional regulator
MYKCRDCGFIFNELPVLFDTNLSEENDIELEECPKCCSERIYIINEYINDYD